MPKLSGGNEELVGRIIAVVFWGLFATGEGWVQFDNVARRVTWLMVSCLTILLLFQTRPDGPQAALLCLIPAFFEFVISIGARKRPWVWLVATPTIYGSTDVWAGTMTSATGHVMDFISNAVGLPLTINREVAGAATLFGVILITRAIVGSFLASRKFPDARVGGNVCGAFRGESRGD